MLQAYHIWPLLCWGRFLLCPFFWRVLITNGCWILSKAFSASIEMIIWFLSFSFLIWCIPLTDLHILKNPCIPGINPTWLYCMSFLMCCRTLFWWGFLHLCLSMILACSFSLCVCCLLFWYQHDGGLVEWVWKFTFFCNFLEEFE